MSGWNYPLLNIDETKQGKAVSRNVSVSIKDLYNVCKAIRGKKLQDAKKYLDQVIEKKEAVPYWRYSTGASHKSGLETKWHIKDGRYPIKAAKYVLKTLENAEANAVSKGLDPDSLKIVHIAAHKGLILKRYMPRAFGRATAKNRRTSHIEVIVAEV
ncbi:50S ribosomal protein L22 [Acidianus brierleyi]|uniref:Large ribosomal subunit protein uL22 n=1 Tax=Acidianus brierleyi TaxID=41673 RepID=A0A2U9IEC6_9CREN|nr:50S ribosomal protein L22 [Acidianus brierleyi]AWR94397.1 50S ribosomal protein L22 [Acidianus brierleyi]